MKHYKPTIETKDKQVDWSKPMWVISDDNMIVLTTGECDEKTFTGTCLPCNDYPNGDYSKAWTKRSFTPTTGTIMFPISNDND